MTDDFALEMPIRILLVEDDVDTGRATAMMLEMRKVQVTLVGGIDDALRIFSPEAFDAVVTDIRLERGGERSGVDILRHIRKELPDFPVILVTGYDTINSAVQAVRLGAQDYILKPLTMIEDLLVPVEKAVRHYRLLLHTRALEDELRTSEERHRAMFGSAQDGMALADPDTGLILDCNSALCRMVGRTKRELVGRSHAVLHPPEDLVDGELPSFREHQCDQLGRAREERLIAGDGRTIPVEILAAHIRIGSRSYLMGVFRDVTERKKGEEALRESEERYRFLLNNTGDFIARFDRNGVMVFGTEVSRRFHGYDLSEILYSSGFERIHPEDRAKVRDEMNRIIETGSEGRAEYRLKRKDGTYMWVEASGMRLFNRAGEPEIVVVQRNIDARKKADEEMDRLRGELYHLDRVSRMGEMAAALAHELNQPLTGILSNAQAAQLMLARDKPDIGEIRGVLDDIVRDDKRAGEVISRLRAFLRHDTSTRETFPINDLVQDLLRITCTDATLRNVTIAVELHCRLPLVTADRIQIQEILLNLVLNAEQAMSDMPAGDRRIVISTAPGEDGGVEVSVQDRGPGFNKDRLSHLFNPFHTTKPNGLGLGLSICKAIVEAHGGRICVVNQPGGGARVTFTLPEAN